MTQIRICANSLWDDRLRERREKDAKPWARLTDRLIWSLSRNGVLMKHDQKRLHRQQRQWQLFIWSSAHKFSMFLEAFLWRQNPAGFRSMPCALVTFFNWTMEDFFFVALPRYQNRNIIIKTEHKMIHDNNKISHHQHHNPNNIARQTIV